MLTKRCDAPSLRLSLYRAKNFKANLATRIISRGFDCERRENEERDERHTGGMRGYALVVVISSYYKSNEVGAAAPMTSMIYAGTCMMRDLSETEIGARSGVMETSCWDGNHWLPPTSNGLNS